MSQNRIEELEASLGTAIGYIRDIKYNQTRAYGLKPCLTYKWRKRVAELEEIMTNKKPTLSSTGGAWPSKLEGRTSLMEEAEMEKIREKWAAQAEAEGVDRAIGKDRSALRIFAGGKEMTEARFKDYVRKIAREILDEERTSSKKEHVDTPTPPRIDSQGRYLDAPEEDVPFWMPPYCGEGCIDLVWDGDTSDFCFLNQGNVFATKEAAEMEMLRRKMKQVFRKYSDGGEIIAVVRERGVLELVNADNVLEACLLTDVLSTGISGLKYDAAIKECGGKEQIQKAFGYKYEGGE